MSRGKKIKAATAIFHVDDDEDVLEEVKDILGAEGYSVISHQSWPTFEQTLREHANNETNVGLFIFDRLMDDERQHRVDVGGDLPEIAIGLYPEAEFIMFTGFGDAEGWRATNLPGRFEYVLKDEGVNRLRKVVDEYFEVDTFRKDVLPENTDEGNSDDDK